MPKRENLAGRTYGRWHVLYYAGNRKWHCRCSCEKHTEKDVATQSLKNGTSLSCGCYKYEKIREQLDSKMSSDLIGYEMTNFIVKEFVGDNKWLCTCKHCGKDINLTRSTILQNKRYSCGCQKSKPKENLVGKRYGLWQVVSYAGHSKWNCICDCKRKTKSIIETHKLLSGESTKCKFHRNTNKIVFPDWFVEDLLDKSLVGSINTHDKVDFVCPIHGIYVQAVSEHIRLYDNKRKSGCPECAKAINTIGSKHENDIIYYVTHEFPGINVVTHTKDLLDGKEIDIYLPDYKIGIEYNGSAFHATENGVFGNKDKYYHRDKFLLAREKGIHLITVFDIDYTQNCKFILNLICNNILGFVETFIPSKSIEYTNNDYDIGTWMNNYGYEELNQIEPENYVYRGFLVYRCGKTAWIRKQRR